jgi:hypothetical protein
MILRSYSVHHPSEVPNVSSLRFSTVRAEARQGSDHSPKCFDRLAAKVLSGPLVLPR